MAYSFKFLNWLTLNLKKANPKHNNYFIILPHQDHKTITINCHISSYSLIALPTIDNHPHFWLRLRIKQTSQGHYLITDDGFVYQHISSDSKLIQANIRNLPKRIHLSAEAEGYEAHEPMSTQTHYVNHRLSLKVHQAKSLVDGLNWLITLAKSIFAYQIAANNHYYIAI